MGYGCVVVSRVWCGATGVVLCHVCDVVPRVCCGAKGVLWRTVVTPLMVASFMRSKLVMMYMLAWRCDGGT